MALHLDAKKNGLLNKFNVKEVPKRNRKNLKRIRQTVDRPSRIVKDILLRDLVDAESGEMKANKSLRILREKLSGTADSHLDSIVQAANRVGQLTQQQIQLEI